MPRDYEEIHIALLSLGAKTLIEEKLASLKLVATRILIKFSRKIKPEILQPILSGHLESIIDELANLLDSASLDTLHLPIEAFTQYSRLNEDIVA